VTDINRALAEDAAEEYSTHSVEQLHFVMGWLAYCDGKREPDKVFLDVWNGYIAARDAPE